MKILRVSLSYPRINMPGEGLPCYYHANYSEDDNLIITLKMEGEKIASKIGIRIEEISIKNPSLGKLDDSLVKRLGLLLKKIVYQMIFLFKSIKIINDFKPDIVHVYSPIPILFGVYCKAKYCSKIILSMHGTDVERVLKSRLFKRLLLVPDRVVCVSETMLDKLKHLKTRKKIEYIGNGYEKNIFFPQNLVRLKQFVNVASFRWQKGHKFLLEAFARFIIEYPEYKLILIGDGPEKDQILRLIKKFNLNNNIILKGIQTRENIAYELNRSEAFILSSVIEGFPKVVIEAMATGTPVISSDVGNISNLVKDSGIICKAGDSFDLYNAMVKFKENEEQWHELSNKAISISKQYSWEKVAMNLNRIYKE